jgi:hypothetical protein
VAAGAAFGQEPVGCVLKFLVLASRLLQGDIEGSNTAFTEFAFSLRSCRRAILKNTWDFTGLTSIAAKKDADPLVRFLLMTLIDVQTGKLPLGGMTFFNDLVADQLPRPPKHSSPRTRRQLRSISRSNSRPSLDPSWFVKSNARA